MSENREQNSTIFKLDISGTSIMVTFSNIETTDIKAKIRDILTESYEERLQYLTNIHASCVRGR